ncbi:8211_t:CDS:2, partial [Gigaspora margarita]
LLLTMLAIQPMDTNNASNADDQIIQRVDSMDLDDLPSHTAKKVKTTLLEETPTITFTESSPTQTSLIQNDKKLKPPKISQGTSIPKQQLDSTQIKQYTDKQNKDIAMETNDTLEQERQALLTDELLSFDFEVTELGPPNSVDNMTPTTTNTEQYMMDTDATFNATIEGTKVPHRLYSSVLLDKS